MVFRVLPMTINHIKPNAILRGPIFPEPVQVIVVVPMGDALKLIAKGLQSSRVYEPILTAEQLAALESTPDTEPFDGDPQRFRIAVEAMRLALAYEYDPYFSLSIARVDPLPHQLEAVYHHFMALPRIRFLLADDPGAGKTIMAGLLLKELKIRGLACRTLIITPASLSFQWQREMKDKFRENFEIIRSDVLRANYGSNPWQDKNQVITSVSWVSRIADARESLLRSHWDLIIVDEAHKMSAASRDKTTLAYDLGAELSKMTDHYLLMTATPHKGDPDNFCLFLELLDRDVYGDVKSLEEAMRKQEAPFYLRRVKEALVTFPDPQTGKAKQLFTRRIVRTTAFEIGEEGQESEWEFYDALTRFVEDQSIKAASEDSARGRALGFTMAMLQRRFASSIYAVRRSLQRMKEKRERILADPEGYRQAQIDKRLPDDFDDLTDEERQQIIADLEELVASYDPAVLRDEITLKEYLEQVWAAVAKEALTMIFKDADTTGFEEDARLTAMWLWTLNAGNIDTANGDSAEDDDADDESQGAAKKAKTTGFVLEYDAARKIAQGLGAHLEDLATVVQVAGEQARLLPVAERAVHLFGKDEGKAAPVKKKKASQLDLFKVLEDADARESSFGETKVERHGETALDRIHQSMILFAAGRGEALKRFLVEDGVVAEHDKRGEAPGGEVIRIRQRTVPSTQMRSRSAGLIRPFES